MYLYKCEAKNFLNRSELDNELTIFNKSLY